MEEKLDVVEYEGRWFVITKRYIRSCSDNNVDESHDESAPDDEWTKCANYVFDSTECLEVVH